MATLPNRTNGWLFLLADTREEEADEEDAGAFCDFEVLKLFFGCEHSRGDEFRGTRCSVAAGIMMPEGSVIFPDPANWTLILWLARAGESPCPTPQFRRPERALAARGGSTSAAPASRLTGTLTEVPAN